MGRSNQLEEINSSGEIKSAGEINSLGEIKSAVGNKFIGGDHISTRDSRQIPSRTSAADSSGTSNFKPIHHAILGQSISVPQEMDRGHLQWIGDIYIRRFLILIRYICFYFNHLESEFGPEYLLSQIPIIGRIGDI